MNFHLLVTIFAFSTIIDVSESALCYSRGVNVGAPMEGSSSDCTGTDKCYAFFDTSGNNIGLCHSEGCDANIWVPGKKILCKECTGDNCNKRSLIRKCYDRPSGAAADSEGTKDTQCGGTPTDAKCIAYYNDDGKNIGACNDGGCIGVSGATSCRACATDNCNKRSLIRKCHFRDADTAAGDEGSLATCSSAFADAKCVAYTEGGKNWAKCNDAGCDPTLKASNPDCVDCTTNECNKRSLIPTTVAPTTAAGGADPTTCAAATRASVGWQTGVIAASAYVLVLMKLF